ncbi:hypothetical protein [Alkalihalobacillus sp. AL-G]|uniref:hypothetical protein n=1 Tax=Alkalihalobacillus sp. AL-G TaxID=2926399 RepID=UPI00272B3EB8|nr:hypothetical protein [Alkalihalobacillus sp. AL-G]WLD93954.1 alpha/beta hydrolase [Alkalihalobacillus sp. AL-G]
MHPIIGKIPYNYYEPEKAAANKRVTLILYHGWGSSIRNLDSLAQILAKWGYHVFAPEIRYHDTRDGLADPFNREIQENYFWKTILESVPEVA